MDGNGAATGEATVYESGLVVDGDDSETTTGTITINADAGLKSVTIGGTEITFADLKNLPPGGIGIDTPEGRIVITGFTPGNSGSTVYSGSIAYTYTLERAQSTPGAAENSETIALVVKDKNDLTGSGSLIVQIIDHTPTAVNDTASMVKSVGTVSGNVYTNDKIGADGAAVAGPVTAITGGTVGNALSGTYGSITLNADGSYTYTVNSANAAVIALTAGSALTETFTYTITDADGDTDTATLTITINGNTPPVANDDVRSTPEDTPVSGNVIGSGDVADSDADGDTLTVTGFTIDGTPYLPGNTASIPGVGELTLNTDGSYTFTPVADWHGTVPTVTYTISDGSETDTATLTIIVTPVVDIADDTATTRVNQPVTTPVLDNDSFEGTPVITGTTPPAHGEVTINPNGSITYTPDPGYTGPDSYTYTVTSGGVTETATVNITVTNAPPVANDDVRSTPEDTPVSGNVIKDGGSGDVADSDADNDPLTVTGFSIGGTPYLPGSTATIPGVGELTLNTDGSYTFTPVPDWNGTVPPVTYTVSDGSGASNGTATATLTITVTPVADIADDTISTLAGSPVKTPVLDNDSFEGTPVVSGTTPPAHGKVTINPDGSITYTPDPGFSGEDSYTYTVTSGGVTETATVRVTVIPENPPPPTPPGIDETPQSPLAGPDPTKPLVLTQNSPVVLDAGPYFASERFDDVRRLPLPFHPIVYVNREVASSQAQRAADDPRSFSDPAAVMPGEHQPVSLGAGLGMDINLFVTHAVRDSQRDAGFLKGTVEGRYSRLDLGSDGYLPSPSLFRNPATEVEKLLEQQRQKPKKAAAVSDQAGNGQGDVAAAAQADKSADEPTEKSARAVPQRLAGGAAPSFGEQLRSGAARLPLAPRKA